MSNQINLASKKRKKILNRETLLQILQFFARISLILVVISAITLFVLNRTGNLPVLEQQDKTISSNLTFVQQKIIKFLLIRERLQDIDPLLSKGSTIDTVLATISSSVPTDVSIDNLTLQDKKLTIAVSSSSLQSINTLLNSVIDKVNQKQVFKTVSITSFSLDSGQNKYVVNLDFTYYE